jgi:acyl-CoA synthetase (AMP-forming)/AMP-acid ligase II
MNEVPAWGTVPRMLRDRAAWAPDVPVIVDGNTTLTTAQLRSQAAAVGRALLGGGIRAGDRVAVWAPNSWQWVVAAFGVWDVGAIVVPISTRAKGLEAAEILRKTGARLVFVVGEFLGTNYLDSLRAAAGGATAQAPYEELPELAHVVLLAEQPDRPAATTWSDFTAWGDDVEPARAEAHAIAVNAWAPFEILMTSGTTGEPKGVVLDGAQILRAYWDWSEICGLGPGDRYPIVSPFAHGFGINAGMLICVARSATMLPIAVFDPDAALELIEAHRVTTLAGPPNLFERILTNPDLDKRDVGSLRWTIVGAASVPTELIRAMRERLGVERVTNAYGLIEGSAVTMTRPGDPPEIVASSAGRPVPGMEVRIVDDDLRPLPPGERGEILVRGYGVMHGYWNAPDLTAAALIHDGWLRTGDVGALDANGNLSIVGRKKEMLIVGGFNAYPAEIENLLLHDPRIAQVAVIGVPDARLGEVPWAYVVPNPSADLTAEDVIAWARGNLSNYKVPRRVHIMPELPVTANGKIEKGRLQQLAHEQLHAPVQG